MKKTITQDGEAVTFLAHYWRHFCEYRDPHPTLVDAVRALLAGADNGDLAKVDVLAADGTVLIDNQRLSQIELDWWNGVDLDDLLTPGPSNVFEPMREIVCGQIAVSSDPQVTASDRI